MLQIYYAATSAWMLCAWQGTVLLLLDTSNSNKTL